MLLLHIIYVMLTSLCPFERRDFPPTRQPTPMVCEKRQLSWELVRLIYTKQLAINPRGKVTAYNKAVLWKSALMTCNVTFLWPLT